MNSIKFSDGGVCAAKGFKANGIHCGIRKNRAKKDLALIVSEAECNVACVYTKNLVKGAPIAVTKRNVADGKARALICNSGNANTCNSDGEEKAYEMCRLCADALGMLPKDIIVASTGVIGQTLDIEPIRNGMKSLTEELCFDSTLAAEAIMTTDLERKDVAVSFEIGGKLCHLGGIAKGSGMIHPNMATMLVFITTDAAISSEMLQKALSEDVKDSFNMVSVDGDTSTNDMVSVLANGFAGNAEITSENEDYAVFAAALAAVTKTLCKKIAADGEGASKLLECTVTGAKTVKVAKSAAKSTICSSLVKAAMFGADANWGRILCAVGYCGEDIDITKIDVAFSSKAGLLPVCENGCGIDFSEDFAKEVLSEKEIEILIDLHDGEYSATAWGCDLTYEYVKINGDYRT